MKILMWARGWRGRAQRRAGKKWNRHDRKRAGFPHAYGGSSRHWAGTRNQSWY